MTVLTPMPQALAASASSIVAAWAACCCKADKAELTVGLERIKVSKSKGSPSSSSAKPSWAWDKAACSCIKASGVSSVLPISFKCDCKCCSSVETPWVSDTGASTVAGDAARAAEAA